MKKYIPLIWVQLFSYQLLRGIAYMHRNNFCHRDLKPQNLLIDDKNAILKICDFGSAKEFKKNEKNVAYICSRYYRAPELIFGSDDYNTKIDIWSIGCIISEMLLGFPIFAGESSIDQLVEIIKVRGTPTNQQVTKNYVFFIFFLILSASSYRWQHNVKLSKKIFLITNSSIFS